MSLSPLSPNAMVPLLEVPERILRPLAPEPSTTRSSNVVPAVAPLLFTARINPVFANRIFSAAVSELPREKTSSVVFTEALNVASASAWIEAATRIASVPEDSSGA